jgi:putative endonuclease
MKQTYRFGILAEKISMIFLFLKGYKILAWRYKTAFGEVDIIAKKSRVIVAIEVKARTSKLIIEEVLHSRQIKRVKMAAEIFYAKNPQFHDHDLRFDFIEVNRFFYPKHHVNFIS